MQGFISYLPGPTKAGPDFVYSSRFAFPMQKAGACLNIKFEILVVEYLSGPGKFFSDLVALTENKLNKSLMLTSQRSAH